jgi:hypothetical protein
MPTYDYRVSLVRDSMPHDDFRPLEPVVRVLWCEFEAKQSPTASENRLCDKADDGASNRSRQQRAMIRLSWGEAM